MTMTPAELNARMQHVSPRISRAIATFSGNDGCAAPMSGKSFGVRRQREPLATGDGAFSHGVSPPKAASRYRFPPHSNRLAISSTAGKCGHSIFTLGEVR